MLLVMLIISGAILSASIMRSVERDSINSSSRLTGYGVSTLDMPPRDLNIWMRVTNISELYFVLEGPGGETLYKGIIKGMGSIKLSLIQRGSYKLIFIPSNNNSRYEIKYVVEIYGFEKDLFNYSLYILIASLIGLAVLHIWRGREYE